MSDPKLIALLKKLTPEEFSELEKFVMSPYFARGRNFEPLFKLLKPLYPDFPAEKMTREILFRELYKGVKYDAPIADNKIKILFSGLYKLCLDFLIQLEFNADKERKEYYLLIKLRTKKLYKEFDKKYSEVLKEKDNPLKGSYADLTNKYFFLQNYKNYSLNRDNYENVFRTSVEMREHGLAAGLVEALKYQNEKNIMKSYNIEPGFTMLEELLDKLRIEEFLETMKKENHKFYPLLYINYLEYLMQKDGNKIEHLVYLKNYLRQNGDHFGRVEKYAMYLRMESYCNRGMSEYNNKTAFSDELFSIYNEMLELKIYKIHDGEDFNIVLFRNMVMQSVSIKQFDWLEQFLEKYSDEINEFHRNDMENYARSMLELGRGNYEKALSHLMKIEFELFLYKTDVRMELLKIYYELESADQFFSAADATLNYLKNRSIHPGKINSGYINFVLLIKELVKIRYDVNREKDAIEQLKRKIETTFVYYQKWLIEKCEAVSI